MSLRTACNHCNTPMKSRVKHQEIAGAPEDLWKTANMLGTPRAGQGHCNTAPTGPTWSMRMNYSFNCCCEQTKVCKSNTRLHAALACMTVLPAGGVGGHNSPRGAVQSEWSRVLSLFGWGGKSNVSKIFQTIFFWIFVSLASVFNIFFKFLSLLWLNFGKPKRGFKERRIIHGDLRGDK